MKEHEVIEKVEYGTMTDAARQRDGNRCVRCQKRSRQVWTIKVQVSWDGGRKEWLRRPSQLGDLVTMCGDCASLLQQEREARNAREVAKKKRKEREARAQVPAFEERFFVSTKTAEEARRLRSKRA